MTGFAYILKSLKNNQYYIGSTINTENRLSLHNDGKVKSTKNIRLLEVALIKKYDNVSEARRIKYKIKKLKRKNYLEKMIKNQDINLGC